VKYSLTFLSLLIRFSIPLLPFPFPPSLLTSKALLSETAKNCEAKQKQRYILLFDSYITWKIYTGLSEQEGELCMSQKEDEMTKVREN